MGYTMKCIYVCDLHGNPALYGRLFGLASDYDAVLIGGDLCPHTIGALDASVSLQRAFLESLVARIREFRKKHKTAFYCILGNDDFRIHEDVLVEADKENILHYCHMRRRPLGTKSVVGYAFVSELPFDLKDWEKHDTAESDSKTDPMHEVRSTEKAFGTIAEDMEKLAGLSEPAKTVYLIHAPPHNTALDIIRSNAHVGSKSIRRFIEKNRPLLTLHGHIHESFEMTGRFRENIGSSVCVNPGCDQLYNRLHTVTFDSDDITAMKHHIIHCAGGGGGG